MAVGTADYSIKNLNEKTNAEIEGFLKKSKEELFNLRFQHATGQLENTARLKAVKSDIARMYTVLRERELGISQERNFRKVRRGYVVSDKMDKTITVELEQRSTHPLYGKVVRSTSKVKAHDEHNDAHIGDLVSIMETRPLSKTKRWRLESIIERAK